MKPKNALLLFFSFVMICAHVNGQDYYWSNSKKIPLIKNEGKVLVRAISGSETEQSLQRNTDIGSIERINANSILITAKKGRLASDSQILVTNQNYTWTYLSEDEGEVIPTGELLIMPKKGIGFKEINKLSGNQLTVVK
tara:strand:+ start:725 stop:1141 length:417 start_codon:yes stop_codon:yes gene_type:complete